MNITCAGVGSMFLTDKIYLTEHLQIERVAEY